MSRNARLNRLLAISIAACGLLAPVGSVRAQNAETTFAEKMVTPELLTEVRKGGYVLYMRHGATDNSRADRAPTVDLNDCNTQRVLNDEGRRQSVTIGQTIARAKIPVGEVYFSPMCRARESAELAFPAMKGKMQAEPNLAYTANLTAEEKKPVLVATRKLVSTPVAAGTNRVLVAHAPNMADLMGYFVKPEGTVVVLRPLGQNQFEYLGSIPPSLWASLVK